MERNFLDFPFVAYSDKVAESSIFEKIGRVGGAATFLILTKVLFSTRFF